MAKFIGTVRGRFGNPDVRFVWDSESFCNGDLVGMVADAVVEACQSPEDAYHDLARMGIDHDEAKEISGFGVPDDDLYWRFG